jgi:hypothetical protein
MMMEYVLPKTPNLEVPDKQGPMTKQILRDAVYPFRSQAKHCYDKALRIYPKLFGKTTMYFEVGASGAVLQAGIKFTTMSHQGVESCLLRVVKRLKFPKREDGRKTLITFPWVFKQDGE